MHQGKCISKNDVVDEDQDEAIPTALEKKNGTEIICIEWSWCRCYTIHLGSLWCVRKVGISLGINCLTQGKIAESNRHSFLHWKKKFIESTN